MKILIEPAVAMSPKMTVTTSASTTELIATKTIKYLEAYYFLKSITRLQWYFASLRKTIEVSTISVALSKDEWATKFHKDKNARPMSILGEILDAASANRQYRLSFRRRYTSFCQHRHRRFECTLLVVANFDAPILLLH